MTPTRPEIAGMIDHAVLKPDATDDDVRTGTEVALHCEVASLCVRPVDLPLARPLLNGSAVKLSTVIGFPHGADTSATKLRAAREALDHGAEELDIVLAIGKLRSGDINHVASEIRELTELVHDRAARIKIIFETAYLSDEEIVTACSICSTAGADWVKTSTGFGPAGATPDQVALMRKHSPPEIQVKASGGIRDLDTLLRFAELGCSRIGTSSTEAILAELEGRK